MPPGLEKDWDSMDWYTQVLLLQYEAIREYEEAEENVRGAVNVC